MEGTSEGEYCPLKISASPKFPDHESESIKSNFKPGDALKHLMSCKVTQYVTGKNELQKYKGTLLFEK